LAKRFLEELEGSRDRRGVGFSAWGGKRSNPKAERYVVEKVYETRVKFKK